jgi:hypothetical protein
MLCGANRASEYTFKVCGEFEPTFITINGFYPIP